MGDEFLGTYLQDPSLQAKYGDYGTYRNFMMSQNPANSQGIGPVYQNNLVAENQSPNLKNIAKEFIKNKIMNKSNLKLGIMDMIPGGLALGIASQFLPEQDPVVTATRDYFSDQYGGLDDIGRINEGDLMQGYNPVSGGFPGVTEPNLGLTKSYDKRIKTIREKGIPTMLARGADPTNLMNRLSILEARKANDLKAMNIIKNDPGITKRALNLKMTGGRRMPASYNPTSSQDKGAAIHGGGSKTISYSAPKSKAPRKSSFDSSARGKALHG